MWDSKENVAFWWEKVPFKIDVDLKDVVCPKNKFSSVFPNRYTRKQGGQMVWKALSGSESDAECDSEAVGIIKDGPISRPSGGCIFRTNLIHSGTTCSLGYKRVAMSKIS